MTLHILRRVIPWYLPTLEDVPLLVGAQAHSVLFLLHKLVYRVLLACDALIAIMSKKEHVENDTHDEDAAQELVVVVAHEVLSKPTIREERQELGVVVELHALVLVWWCLLRPLARWCALWPLLGIFFFGKMMFWLLIMLLVHLLVPVFEELVMLLSIVLRKATALPFLKVFSFFLVPSIHILSLLPFSTLFGLPVLA